MWREIGSPWSEKRNHERRRWRRRGKRKESLRNTGKSRSEEKELYPRNLDAIAKGFRVLIERISSVACDAATAYCPWKLPLYWHVFNNVLTWPCLSHSYRFDFFPSRISHVLSISFCILHISLLSVKFVVPVIYWKVKCYARAIMTCTIYLN